MIRLSIRRLGPALVAASSLVTVSMAAAADDDKPRKLRARAIIRGAPGSSIEGVVNFRQRACPGCPTPGLAAPATDPGFKNFPEPTVEIEARIEGSPAELTPGAHGMHIHETGSCDPPAFATANGHFDPGPSSNSAPDANHPFHMGDIPNLIVDEEGEGSLQHRTSRITLSPGPLSVFDVNGSAVIVHSGPDRGITGPSGASGGPRIACGIIELVADDDDEDDDGE